MKENNIWDVKYKDLRIRQGIPDFILLSPTLEKVRQYVYKGAKVLEIGSGTGQFAVSLSLLEKDVDVFCLDFSAESISKIKDLAILNQARVNINQAEIEHMPFTDNYFDIIFGDQVIGHVDNIDVAMKEIRRVLKPGGFVILNGPNLVRFDAWPMYDYLKSQNKYRIRHFIPSSFRKIFISNGFYPIASFGESFFFFRTFRHIINTIKKPRQNTDKINSTITYEINRKSGMLKLIKDKIEYFMPAWSKANYGIVAKKS